MAISTFGFYHRIRAGFGGSSRVGRRSSGSPYGSAGRSRQAVSYCGSSERSRDKAGVDHGVGRARPERGEYRGPRLATPLASWPGFGRQPGDGAGGIRERSGVVRRAAAAAERYRRRDRGGGGGRHSSRGVGRAPERTLSSPSRIREPVQSTHSYRSHRTRRLGLLANQAPDHVEGNR